MCLLRKSLYGLKQSPRQWYKKFDSVMIRAGYSRCEYDSCVYFLQGKDPTYLLLYVDDMLIAARSKAQVQKVKAQLKREFDMKDLGEVRKILGMEITRDRSTDALWLSQENYVLKVLERFNMTEARPVTTPLAGHFRLSSEQCPQSPGEEDEMSRVPYASAVGSLMYAMVCTRPDLAFAVSSVSRFMSNPGKQHWEAAKWIFRYLRGTAKLGLEFRKREREESRMLQGYVDADFGGDLDKRRSTTGYVFTLAEYVISWKAELQDTVALSTTEAEYMAAVEASKEALWLKGLVGTFGIIQDSVRVHCDARVLFILRRTIGFTRGLSTLM